MLSLLFALITILDNIRSAHNVGSIFRTADAVGVSKIYLCGITPAPLDKYKQPVSKITKVSLGAEQSVKWEKCKSTIEIIRKLKKQNYKIYAVEQADNSVPYDNPADNADKIALVIGNEVEGLSLEIIATADQVREIPMHGQKESLNVSVAFGIAAFALTSKQK